MINTNRALGISLTVLAVTTVALALVSMPGCASDKPTAPMTPPPPPPQPVSLSQIKSELLAAKSQLRLTSEALNRLQESSTADADANFNAFTEEFTKLQAKSEAVSARSEDLKEKASAYYETWNRQVDVENPDLRRQAVQQKADAERLYNTITSEMELARIAFKPYMSNLKDIGNYLRGNISPATLTTVRDLVDKSNKQAQEVEGHITEIVNAVDKIQRATGEGVAADGTR